MDWPIGSLLAAKHSVKASYFCHCRCVCRLQAEARLLAELDALKREQQADGARIKQEVRRGAARRGAARRGHTHCGTAQHSTAQQRRPTD
jgi:hypothetical protein